MSKKWERMEHDLKMYVGGLPPCHDLLSCRYHLEYSFFFPSVVSNTNYGFMFLYFCSFLISP